MGFKKPGMRKLIAITLLLSSLAAYSQRYLTDDYVQLDSVIGGIYGTASDYQNVTQNLLFDFYEPAHDNITKRPLVIYLHGGGFTSGSRTYPSVQSLCRRMAQRGYAVANIDYRLDPNFDLYNSSGNRRAMTDAMHDAKQAIRYFKANAATYKVDTSLVFIGGESAGAITSMMASFVDKQEEMDVYPMANPNNPIGSTSNADVSNSVKGTLCLCGMILDTMAMELPTDPTLLWIHGTNDDFIPVSLAFNVLLRASHIGLPVAAKTYQGATHCPWYYGNPNWAIYLDSVTTDITNFLYPIVTSTAIVNQARDNKEIQIYPNPFHYIVTVNGISFNARDVKIYSLPGEELTRLIRCYDQNIDLSRLPVGVYVLKIRNYADIIYKK